MLLATLCLAEAAEEVLPSLLRMLGLTPGGLRFGIGELGVDFTCIPSMSSSSSSSSTTEPLSSSVFEEVLSESGSTMSGGGGIGRFGVGGVSLESGLFPLVGVTVLLPVGVTALPLLRADRDAAVLARMLLRTVETVLFIDRLSACCRCGRFLEWMETRIEEVVSVSC